MKNKKFEPCKKCQKDHKINNIIKNKYLLTFVYLLLASTTLVLSFNSQNGLTTLFGCLMVTYIVGIADQNNRLYKLFNYKEMLETTSLRRKRKLCYKCEYNKKNKEIKSNNETTWVLIFSSFVSVLGALFIPSIETGSPSYLMLVGYSIFNFIVALVLTIYNYFVKNKNEKMFNEESFKGSNKK